MLGILSLLSSPAISLALAFGGVLGMLAAGVHATRANRQLIKHLLADGAACDGHLSREVIERNQTLSQRLTEQENKLSTVIRSAPVCIKVQAADGTILEINPAGTAMFEAESAEQVIGSSIYNFICPKYHERYAALTRRVFRGEEGKVEFDVVGPLKQLRRLEAHAVPMYAPDGTVNAMLAITLDVTEQQRIADEFRQNEARLRAIIESEPECVKLETADGTLLDMNPAGLAILEVTNRDRVVGKSIYRVIDPEHHAAYRAHSEAVFRGEKSTLEFRMVTSKGNWCWLETHAVPMRDGSGEVVALLGITRDVTARKQAEEKLLQRQMELAHVCRLANLNEMASGLAHELNQPLCAISTYAEAVARTLKTGDTVPKTACERLQHISAQAERAGMIIRGLRNLVAKKPMEPQAVSVNHLIRDVMELLQPEFTAKSVSVRHELADALPLALVDPIHFEQVILNLARNAADAMSHNRGPKELFIRTRGEDHRCIEISVHDNGPGVSETDIGKVFSAFYTTKENGIGMGLSISRSIIEAHNGRIGVSNNATGGACFNFTLPALASTRRSDDKAPSQECQQVVPARYRHAGKRRSGAAAHAQP